jgi:hypothetical protein
LEEDVHINISVMYPEHYPKMVLNIRRANI